MKNGFIQKYRYQVILVLSAFLLYSNTIKNGYALDDEYVTESRNITSKGLKAVPKIFRTYHVSEGEGNNYEYRPMVKLSYALEAQIFGVHAGISHFFNIIFYAICLLLLYKLLLLIFPAHPPFIIFLSVLIFSFLPIHSEVVASLKNRDVLLCFIFSLLGFIALLRYQLRRKLLLVPLALLCFALAFLTKYDVMPYAAIVGIVMYRKNLKFGHALIAVALFLIALYVYFLVKKNMLDKTQFQRVFKYYENPLFFVNSFSARLSAMFNSLGFYIKMLLIPTKMSCYYGYAVIPVFSFTTFYGLLGIVGAGLLVYLFIYRFKQEDLMWHGVLFFCTSLSMYLNFVRFAPGIVADRFAFFASVGFALILAQLLYLNKKTKQYPNSFSGLKMYQKSITILVLLVFSAIVIDRNKDWKDRLTLFEADSNNYPESVKLALLRSSQVIIHLTDKSNTIKNEEKSSKIQSAEKVLVQALKVDSSCTGCYNNLSYLLLSYNNDPHLALQYLMKGYKIDSTRKELLCNIGIAYMKLNKPDSAEKYLIKAIKSDKKHEFLIPYDVLQNLYLKHNIGKGIKFFEERAEEQPASELMNIFLAKLYFEKKDTANSLVYYKKALQINPGNQSVAEFVNKIEAVYYKK